MRTRSGVCYPRFIANFGESCEPDDGDRRRISVSSTKKKRRRDEILVAEQIIGRRRRVVAERMDGRRRKAAKLVFSSSPATTDRADKVDGGMGCSDFFEALPDDLVVFILSKLTATATCPADFINVLITCKRFNELAFSSLVLSKSSQKMLTVKADKWSEYAHQFLKLCVDSGNVEASYILGMIRFYCLQNRGSGASLMAKAAISSHAPALYSLSVIQFNGSGGSKNDKDLRAGVALCARAAFLGHIDALRELGHCLQDGYGVKQNISEGRRFLVQANARELAAVLSATPSTFSDNWLSLSTPANYRLQGDGNWMTLNASAHQRNGVVATGCPLLSDFGCNVPVPEAHPANRFLTDWYAARGGNPGPGLRLCSHSGCGRPETRKHEFRRCSVCGSVNYCSRACQALDWKMRHKAECTPAEQLIGEEGENMDGNVANVDGDVNGEIDGDDMEYEQEEGEEDDNVHGNVGDEEMRVEMDS
ncbi:OLC1v1028640C1 [Oldenlandia corymbosa var. corymbosa]|uniref:OLC1v1028640C1 n=1 Tax=Oldenlandia corymbosa var. corymbosa TaxID=529605 RepID=A0AAV1CCN5_OLDCO|nr:OLC1v1028640C1 [Oldenlandia corymbosa var. corymbosa]